MENEKIKTSRASQTRDKIKQKTWTPPSLTRCTTSARV